MTVNSGFFNSINGDRKYNANDMNRPYKDIISKGVFANPSDQLQVMASSGMTVSVNPGGGLFGNGWAENDAAVLKTIDAAEATLSRIDAIVMRRDESEAVRDTMILVKKGTPSSSPVAPAMIRDDSIDEYCLATIRIAPGTTTITQSMITDTRPDTNVCGWVTGLIDQVDTSTLFTQWESAYKEQYDAFMDEFETWWASVRNILQDDQTAAAEVILLKEEKADRKTYAVTLSASGWTLTDGYYYQSASIEGLTAEDIVIVGYDKSNLSECSVSGLMCVEQSAGTLKFRVNASGEYKVNVINMGS